MASGGGRLLEGEETGVGDLPEACLADVIAPTSPRDACRLAAVSPCFRAAADSDAVWARFLLPDHRAIALLRPPPPPRSSGEKSSVKDVYLGLCDDAVLLDAGAMRVWLEKGSGAKCYALGARKLSLPWEDGEFSWTWTPHPLSRFAEVAQLVDCTCLDIYGRLPAADLTPATAYAAYLVFGTTEGHRGLSFPDQETTLSVGGHVALTRHPVCIYPNEAEERKFRSVGGDNTVLGSVGESTRQTPVQRGDGWSEVEMGRLREEEVAITVASNEEVVANFEVLGWYPKRGLILEGIEFRPMPSDGYGDPGF